MLQVSLVEEGLASVHPTAEKTEFYRQLEAAENTAKNKKLKIWENYVEKEQEEHVTENVKVIKIFLAKFFLNFCSCRLPIAR